MKQVVPIRRLNGNKSIHTNTAAILCGEKKDSVELEGTTVDEVVINLTSKFHQLRQHLYAENGSLGSYVNIYVNDEDIRYREKDKTPVKETDTISIIPSIAGGKDDDLGTMEHKIQLSNEEVLRYSRHLIIPEVGMTGQKKLKASSVLMIGAGGLGSPFELYLAAAGVGKIGIVDFDVVDLTNVHRQVLHSTEDVGRSKLESAPETIRGTNPNVEIDTFEVRLSSENALQLSEPYDIIVDGTDNVPTSYLVNDA